MTPPSQGFAPGRHNLTRSGAGRMAPSADDSDATYRLRRLVWGRLGVVCALWRSTIRRAPRTYAPSGRCLVAGRACTSEHVTDEQSTMRLRHIGQVATHPLAFLMFDGYTGRMQTPPDQQDESPMSPERLARFGDDGGPDGFLRFDPDYEPAGEEET